MKENTNNNSNKVNDNVNNNDANIDAINNDLSMDADVVAAAKQYKRDSPSAAFSDGEHYVPSYCLRHPML